MRLRLTAICALALAGLVVPSAAQAAPCTPSGTPDATMTNTAADVTGTVASSLQGGYILVPVTIPVNTTGIRVQYCYDAGPASPNNNTIDIGAYEPLHPGDTIPGPAERRGWSGSAVKDFAIAENGFSSPAVYGTTNTTRKAYVSGSTTRAYQPGPIPAGTWSFELGLAALEAADTDGIDYHLIVQTSTSSTWNDAPYVPHPYVPTVENPNPGWYQGDVHVHSEQEPGNATVKESLDYGFAPLSSGGAGLDFINLIDHNNDIALKGEDGTYEPMYPGHLIVPGVEVTTYHGHFNNQGEQQFVDYRTGPVYTRDPGTGALTKVRDYAPPSGLLAQASSAGGWSQVNHPTTFPAAQFGALCRGCAWDYSDADTGYSGVDAIEVQNGPAEFGGGQSPFSQNAIDFYQHALATGAHIAAVGSSDSHKATFADATTVPIGGVATAVYATSLSEAGIVAAVKGDHTYAKYYGANGPDIRLTASSPGSPDAIIGDSQSGPYADLTATVLGAGPSAPRPGTYKLLIQRDGVTIDTSTVSGDSYTHVLRVLDTGRYSLEVTRTADAGPLFEDYSSPIWFTRVKPSNAIRFGKLKRNRHNGTATLSVKVPAAGVLTLAGAKVKSVKKMPTAASTVKLLVKPKSKLSKLLRKKGKAKTSVKVKFAPSFGDAATKNRVLKLQRRLKHHKHH